MDELIDITKASELLGVNTKTLRRWDNERKLKAYRTIGNHRRYKIKDIENLIGEINQNTQKEEMVNDLISIVTCFSARLYGSRGGRKVKQDIQKSIKELEKERGENSEGNNESNSSE